jgi:hypothetical protein
MMIHDVIFSKHLYLGRRQIHLEGMWTSVTAIPSQRPLPISSIDENPARMDKKLMGEQLMGVKRG